MPGSPRAATAARHEALADRLTGAAETAIEAGGLPNLRARALADAAGCSVGAIYGVFPDLDALVLAVNARTLEQIEAALAGAETSGDPVEKLRALAAAYLGYAARHRNRWRALFEHRMAGGAAIPAWYATRREQAFSHIATPLAALLPGMTGQDLAVLARTVFSAVHGMVDLGLDEKLGETPPALLQHQLRLIVNAIAGGLAMPHSGGPKS